MYALFLVVLMVQGEQSSLFAETPEGWSSEILPFPLDFAPEINLRGREELRFAPGMFQAEAADYFSYAFLWWLEGDPEINADMLRKNLSLYYKGLYLAVSKKETKDTQSFQVSVNATREQAWIDGASENYRSLITWIDPFVTEKPLTLEVKIAVWHCAKENRKAVYFLVAPQNGHPDLWQKLHALKPRPCE